MGSELNYDLISENPRYRQVHSEEYGLSTAENDCKWQATHPQQNEYTIETCYRNLQYAVNETQAFRGHNLCWGSYNPTWLTCGAPHNESSYCNFTAAELEGFLVDHINTVMPGVRAGVGGASIYAWDVVNEAIDYKPHQGWGLKTNTWYPVLSNYVDVAFQAARLADPDTLLCYNDYGSEDLGGHSTAVYAMVQSMLARGVPIDCVGLQMHVREGQEPTRGDVSANMKRLGLLGLQVHVTELDYKCPDCYYYSSSSVGERGSGDGVIRASADVLATTAGEDGGGEGAAVVLVPNATALAKQATFYTDMLLACLDNPGVCTSFETWGFTDAHTWLGADAFPLPFDTAYAPKPAYDAMLDTLHSAWRKQRDSVAAPATAPESFSLPIKDSPSLSLPIKIKDRQSRRRGAVF